jgi:hypothetical protein
MSAMPPTATELLRRHDPPLRARSRHSLACGCVRFARSCRSWLQAGRTMAATEMVHLARIESKGDRHVKGLTATTLFLAIATLAAHAQEIQSLGSCRLTLPNGDERTCPDIVISPPRPNSNCRCIWGWDRSTCEKMIARLGSGWTGHWSTGRCPKARGVQIALRQ